MIHTYYIIPTIWHSKEGKTQETVKWLVVAEEEEVRMNRQSTQDF